MSFFVTQCKSIKADVERHSQAERDLRAKIASLKNSTDDMDVAACKSYEQLLQKLVESKAEVVAKIGRKKMKMRLRQKV